METLICKYCGKICKNKNSLVQHTIRCKENPNRLDSQHSGGGGGNKGLTKATDERVAKMAKSVLKRGQDGAYEDVEGLNRSHPHSDKTKQRLREVAIERGLGGYTYNKSYEYNGFYFDSNWEVIVAKSLDENNIRGIRPKRLFYKDDENKTRYYYPDFYLIDYDLYLDPKNDYLLNNPHSGHSYNDKQKIEGVQEQNNVRIIILNEDTLLGEKIKLLL